jgi:hypothetical protein
MIKAEDISVVIQGVVNDTVFAQTIPIIAKTLQGCELILSTEKPLTDYEAYFHKVVDSPDPGKVTMEKGFDTFPTGNYGYEWKAVISNGGINRQLESSRNGIEAATRPYVLKIRTDMIVSNLDWLVFYKEALELTKPTKLNQPILTGNYRDVSKWTIFPYHYHDWFNFGLKEDLLKLFSAPKVDTEFALSSNLFSSAKPDEFIFDLRATPETYIGGRLFHDTNEILYRPSDVLNDMINHYVPIDLGLHYSWSLKFPQESLTENCIMSYSSWKKYIKGGK